AANSRKKTIGKFLPLTDDATELDKKSVSSKTSNSPPPGSNGGRLVSPNMSPQYSPLPSPLISSNDSSITIRMEPLRIDEKNDGETKENLEELSNDQKVFLRAKLPLLSDITTIDKRNDTLIAKLQLCCVTFDFKSSNFWQIKGIGKKKELLNEIIEYVSKYAWYSEPILQQCITTIVKNLFRSLPRRRRQSDNEDDKFEDPSWPHLHLVYDLVLRLVICTDIDKKFVF
ncbi:hypothetical protein RFI_24935, partial [Reticulomyxa filosa]